MVAQTHAPSAPVGVPKRPVLRVVEGTPGPGQLHLLTYVVGNALFWILWGAISVSADRWYWWPLVPFVGWTLVLAGHVWQVRRVI